MRLHRLRLTAFGPFAGEQSVDFDELSTAGLFLLHGPTGGGKTSVLDAVCFALYGQVPGDRPATRLRSDHAAPGTATEVVLELTLAGRRLEITRRPEQPRAKKRGTGVTMERAVTHLRERTAGRWHGLTRSHQEAGEEIRQLVGMSCEQFCQVVLLPQGEFATFLRASATERAALLGKLFDTRRFRSVEQRLRDRKQEAAQLLAAGDRRTAELAARMRQAAGEEPAPIPGQTTGEPAHLAAAAAKTRGGVAGPAPAAPGAGSRAGGAPGVASEGGRGVGTSAEQLGLDPAEPAGLLAYAAVLRSNARERHDIARIALAHAEAEHAAAALAAEQARDAHAARRRVEDAWRRVAELGELRPQRTAARETLARAQRATTVDPALTHRDKVAAQHEEALGLERAAASALAQEALLDLPAPARTQGVDGADGAVAARALDPGGPGVGGDGEPASPRGAGRGGVPALDPGALVRRAGDVREALGGLAAAVDVEARVREIAGRRAQAEREEREDEEAVRDAGGWLGGWPEERARLQARLDAALEAAARAGDLAGQRDAARRRKDAAAQRDALAADLGRAEQTAREARDRAADARETWQDLRESRIDGIAAELAAQLAAGEPCRVCGSADHPAPARPTARHVTRADEDAAYARFQQRAADHDAARETATRLRTALEAATATAGDAPQAELAAAHADLVARHDAATRAAATVPEARAALARAEEERDRRTAQQQDALHRAAARTSRREELDEQYERLSGELAKARAGHPTVAARRDHLTRTLALLERAAHAARERADSRQRLAEAESALADAAARAGFATPAEAAAALLPPPRLWAAEREAETWSKEEAAAEAELTTALSTLPPDLSAPEAAGSAPDNAPATAADSAAGPDAAPDLGALARLTHLAGEVAARAQGALDGANLRLRWASAAEAGAAARCADLDRLGAEADAVVRELAPARAAHDRIARLSDLASATSAENRYRMELETYVLAARLEQVAAAAGLRLRRMSGGRYTLAHSDARGGGRTKSGLGLVVVDAWTGTERDTATLSGGETFYASLALALGLADVVTDEAGGMRLDTLFIDEGFGSLDEQALDEVLDVLDGLRERDRAVGIVSHVADLRDRIPAQLRVGKGRDGSTLHQSAR
ncbi:AAA family ATPase [Actinacidiphila epipremni]|uniref:Nuclease SbcCD subunit C n=1 Tax=Actinacidiphila epipremni TaxID=2053013 RepID=A0ABX0ZR25_9ACTN|nr:AAA family ATPase [Actinacidiphila epipremni]NJP46385.1 AAA family ATPase [Actinacidiphila epipremni]